MGSSWSGNCKQMQGGGDGGSRLAMYCANATTCSHDQSWCRTGWSMLRLCLTRKSLPTRKNGKLFFTTTIAATIMITNAPRRLNKWECRYRNVSLDIINVETEPSCLAPLPAHQYVQTAKASACCTKMAASQTCSTECDETSGAAITLAPVVIRAVALCMACRRQYRGLVPINRIIREKRLDLACHHCRVQHAPPFNQQPQKHRHRPTPGNFTQPTI